MLIATNPFTGKTFAEYPVLDAEQIDRAIARAQAALPGWRNRTYAGRGSVLRAVAAELRRQKVPLARLMAEEMGKPVREGEAEVEKSAWCAEHYAGYGEAYLAREVLPSDAALSYVCYQPLGTLLGILPWNAPLWLAFRYLAPALMAGNTCVMKHDPHVPACGRAIAEAFASAGVPDDIMVNLPVATQDVASVIGDPRIAGVSFTGSSAAGQQVAAQAAAHIKPAVLELGGSDPCIVMADADLDRAADIVTLSRIINAGQSCIAAKRIIVEAGCHDDFVERLRVRLAGLTLGDPMNSTTDVGPLARQDLRRNLHRQVRATIAAGARCLLGGDIPGGDGFFYPVTLLTGVTGDMCVFREETFGPVMAVASAPDFDTALALANDTDYGLGASIWTADVKLAARAVVELNAGQVAVNGIVKTDPRLPSGGIKRSGLGRELGPQGIREFVNAKQVWIG